MNGVTTKLNRLQLAFSILIIFGVLTSFVSAKETYTFTNCEQNGRFGPTQEQANAAYIGTDLQGKVSIDGQGIQKWIVPSTGVYRIQASGRV